MQPVRRFGVVLGLLGWLWPQLASSQITDMQFDRTQVARGVDTLTATISVRNPTGGELTYFVAGLTQMAGGTGFFSFSPNRQSVTLASGASGTVELTWSPSLGMVTGAYDFHCRLYRSATGTSTYFTAALPAAYEVVNPYAVDVLGVVISPDPVARNSQSTTASVTLRNAGAAAVTCYLAGLTQPTGGSGWYTFSPTRREVTLALGETGTFDVTWAPPAGTPIGAYDFLCRVHKSSAGSDLFDSLLVSDAFSTIDPHDGAIVDMVCMPDRLEVGLGTVTASVNVVNTGVETLTLYVAGLAQHQGSTGYFPFSPARQPVTLDVGQTQSVDVSWTLPPGASLGSYDFTCRLYRTADSTAVYDEQVLTFAFLVYDPFTARGSVRVNLDPPDAVAAGARWRIDAGAWRQSGETADDLYLGFHHIDFLPVEGWAQPSAFNLSLQAEEEYQATVSYSSASVRLAVARQGGQLALQWPAATTGFQLESSTTIGPDADWAPVPGAQISSGEYLLSPPEANSFYRLGTN